MPVVPASQEPGQDKPKQYKVVPYTPEAPAETPERIGRYKVVPYGETPVSPVEAISAVARRGTGAAIQTGTAIAGATMGAQLGFLGGPAAPVTVPLGATVGFFSGLMAGDTLAQLAEEQTGLVTSSIEDEPEHLRPFAVFGEVTGGAVPFAAAPIVAASRSLRFPDAFPGTYLNRILEHAGHNPAGFAFIEGAAATTAGVAGAISEEVFPGNIYVRVPSEIAGGILSPQRILAGIVTRTGRGILHTVQRFTAAGRQTRAAVLLGEALDAAGEDPELLLRLLRESEIPGVMTPNMTASQLTGSKALAAFEADIRTLDQKFMSDSTRMASEALESTARAIRLLEGTGDPNAIKLAAQVRSEQSRLMIQTRLEIAERRMVSVAEKLVQDTPATRAELSRQSREILDQTLERTRAIERDLWAEIPANTPMGVNGANRTLAKHSAVRGEMLPDDKLPSLMEKTIARLRDARKTLKAFEAGKEVTKKDLKAAQAQLSLGNMMKVRSEFLRLAREAEKNGESNLARQYGTLAESVLDDIVNIPGPASEAYNAARSYSRELNDVFTRTYVGKAMSLDRFGTDTIPPEVFLRRALASGEEMGALQMEQIERATRFLSDRQLGTAIDEQSLQSILDAQERVLRIAAAGSVIRDPASQAITGVNTKSLRNFVTKHDAILNRFPETKQILEEAIQTEAGRQAMVAQATRMTKYMEQRSAFANLIGFESPADAVRGALKGKQPVAMIKNMVNVARNNPDALAGLRVAMFEDAFRSATDRGGRISLQDLASALDDPIRPNLPSLRELMVSEGLLTPAEGAKVQQLVGRVRNILQARATPAAGQPPIEETDVLLDAMLRVKGAQTGAELAGRMSGAQLVAAGRFSSLFRKVFGRFPAFKVQRILIDALSGAPITPDGKPFSLLETLLERAPTAARAEHMVRQVHAYAVQAGVQLIDDAIQGERQ